MCSDLKKDHRSFTNKEYLVSLFSLLEHSVVHSVELAGEEEGDLRDEDHVKLIKYLTLVEDPPIDVGDNLLPQVLVQQVQDLNFVQLVLTTVLYEVFHV